MSDRRTYLIIGITSRALFDLSKENQIFEKHGPEAYSKYQLDHEDEILQPGVAFSLVQGILRLNSLGRRAEVIIMSRNNVDTSLRIWKSIEHYRLDISRGAFTSGRPLAPYLKAFKIDLFLSAYEDDVRAALESGIPAGLIVESQRPYDTSPPDEIRIAFDGDAVLFSDESERIYQERGLEAFLEYERRNARKPLPEGPFAKLLKTLQFLQRELGDKNPIRTALVTSRNSPAIERVVRTFRAWDVRIDEAFFLGGMEKGEVLKAFGAHIFFDDQEKHVRDAAQHVPSARVPYPAQRVSS